VTNRVSKMLLYDAVLLYCVMFSNAGLSLSDESYTITNAGTDAWLLIFSNVILYRL
jgi:hypothetical protein